MFFPILFLNQFLLIFYSIKRMERLNFSFLEYLYHKKKHKHVLELLMIKKKNPYKVQTYNLKILIQLLKMIG
jgi:hypothetical protein